LSGPQASTFLLCAILQVNIGSMATSGVSETWSIYWLLCYLPTLLWEMWSRLSESIELSLTRSLEPKAKNWET